MTRLRTEKSVLVVPGDHFGMDHYLRLGFGEPPEYLRAALERLGEGIADCGLRIADRINPQSAFRIRNDAFDLILIGYGNVARRFESLLAEQRPSLARIVGCRDAAPRCTY